MVFWLSDLVVLTVTFPYPIPYIYLDQLPQHIIYKNVVLVEAWQFSCNPYSMLLLACMYHNSGASCAFSINEN